MFLNALVASAALAVVGGVHAAEAKRLKVGIKIGRAHV